MSRREAFKRGFGRPTVHAVHGVRAERPLVLEPFEEVVRCHGLGDGERSNAERRLLTRVHHGDHAIGDFAGSAGDVRRDARAVPQRALERLRGPVRARWLDAADHHRLAPGPVPAEVAEGITVGQRRGSSGRFGFHFVGFSVGFYGRDVAQVTSARAPHHSARAAVAQGLRPDGQLNAPRARGFILGGFFSFERIHRVEVPGGLVHPVQPLALDAGP